MARTFRSSRLAKKESQRLIKQSLMLMGLSVVIVVGILVWGIPALVRYAGFLGEVKNSEIELSRESGIAPFPPQLEISMTATTSGSLDISGYSQEGVNVTLYNDNVEVGSVVANEAGEFVFRSVKLSKGENTFTAEAQDATGNKSTRSSVNLVWFDNTLPDISLDGLEDGARITDLTNDMLSVSGTTKADASVYINDRLSQADENGEFSQQIRLSEGENRIVIRAVDRAGNSKEIEIKVDYDR